MKSRKYPGLLLLAAGMFLFFGASAAIPQGKKVTFRSAYVAKANPHPKVASALQQAMVFVQKSTKSQRHKYFKMFSPRNPAPYRIDKQNRIQCYIQCRALDKATLEKLNRYGVKVECTDSKRKIAQAWLSTDQIRVLEALPEVKFIRLPSYPVFNVGSVTTEGYDAMHIGDFVHRPEFAGTNVTGNGMKVGVISSAIDRADRSARVGDLPSTDSLPGPWPDNTIGGVIYWSFQSGYRGDEREAITTWFGYPDQEGTAMLEIIHDIVPDARLYFSNFNTDIQMNMSKDWLRSQGCDVIVDDISFFNDGAYDGTSLVSLGSTRQVENGVAYYTSAGNYAERHWWGNFKDPELNNFHNFSYNSQTKESDESMEVMMPPRSSVSVFLSWGEVWGESGYDIDLYLLDPNFLDIQNPISYSSDLQLGDGDPAEGCGIINPTNDPYTFSVVITRKTKETPYDDVNNPMRMNLFLLGGTIVEKDYIVAAGSISNNSDAGGGVIAVGAIDVSSRLHNVVEYYSSHGPTWDGRLKPEIACFDGTSGGSALAGTYFETFFGTSCAAPHVAAVAALVKGYKISIGDPAFTNPYNPKDVVDNINAAIFSGAEDMLPEGIDNASGYGRLNAENIFLNFLVPTARTKRYDFATDTDGWTSVSIPGVFTEPVYTHENGKLILQSTDTNTFGYWESPLVEFSDGRTNLNAGKLYRARFSISTTSTPEKFPGFRIRANCVNYTTYHICGFNSNSGEDHYPGSGGKQYYLWFRATDTEALQGIKLSFDIVNLAPADEPTGTLLLDEVEITEYNQP